jgi:hypothetical protein
MESQMHNSPQTETAARKSWVAPRLTKVGSIGDVAGTARLSLDQPFIFRS